jgi:hypothetical protein
MAFVFCRCEKGVVLMGDESVLYDRYEIPVIEGYEYLFDEKKPVTDYIFINEPTDGCGTKFLQSTNASQY